MFELDQNTVQHRYKVLEYLARTAVDLVATVRRYRYVGTGTALQLYKAFQSAQARCILLGLVSAWLFFSLAVWQLSQCSGSQQQLSAHLIVNLSPAASYSLSIVSCVRCSDPVRAIRRRP